MSQQQTTSQTTNSHTFILAVVIVSCLAIFLYFRDNPDIQMVSFVMLVVFVLLMEFTRDKTPSRISLSQLPEFAEALHLTEERNYGEALELFQTLLHTEKELAPEDRAIVLVNIGICQVEERYFRQAAHRLKEGLETAPLPDGHRKHALFHLVVSCFETKDYLDAKRYSLDLLEMTERMGAEKIDLSHNQLIYTKETLGLAYFHLNDYDNARIIFEEILDDKELEPSTRQATLFNLANVQVESGRLNDAIHLLNELLQFGTALSKTAYRRALHMLCDVQHKEGNTEEAYESTMQMMEESRDANPIEQAPTLYRLTKYSLELDDPDKLKKARIHSEQLILIEPDNHKYQTIRGKVLTRQGDYAEGLHHLKKGLEKTKGTNDKGDIYYWLSLAYFGLGEAETAKLYYHQALELAPNASVRDLVDPYFNTITVEIQTQTNLV